MARQRATDSNTSSPLVAATGGATGNIAEMNMPEVWQ